jgi:ribosomal-protein-alanine N-acetyltransferase
MNLVTESLKLVPCSVKMLQSLIDDAIDLSELMGVQVPEGWPAEELKEVAPCFINLLSQSPDMKERLCWFIVEKEQNIVIGSIGFKAKPDKDGIVEIGFGIDPAFRRQGYATEAVRGLAGWALSQNDIQKVIAECEPDNKPSLRVLEKAGMRKTSIEDNMIKWEIRCHGGN